MNGKIIATGIILLFSLTSIVPSISGNDINASLENNPKNIRPLSFGNVITVDDDLQQCPNADFKKLNLAMDYANNPYNDVTRIDVYPGEYLLGYSYGIDVRKPNMHLHGVGGALKTIIDGESSTTILIAEKNIEVSGFTIKSTGSEGPSGIKVGEGLIIDAINIMIHDCIFDLPYSPWEESTVYGIELTQYCSNVEVYDNDFICDEENAKDDRGIGNWHGNFWEDWDGKYDSGVQGEPYDHNGVYDPTPRWDPIVLSRPSKPSVSRQKVFLRTYKYTIVSTDEDGDNIQYYIKFDGEGYSYPSSGGYIPQGESFVIRHRWKIGSEHVVDVFVCDEHGIYGRESTTLPVHYGLDNRFIDFLENHPLLCQLFQRLLNL